MPHQCGTNKRIYRPSGNGFGPTAAAAVTAAAIEYQAAIRRCVRKIVTWSTKRCPAGCPLRIFAGIAMAPENVIWAQRPDGRWQAYIDHRMTGTVLCLPLPKAAKTPGKKKKKAVRKRGKRRSASTG
jgi:hypothetical protein